MNVFKSKLKPCLFNTSIVIIDRFFFVDVVFTSISLALIVFNFDFYCCKAPLDIG